MRVAIIGSRNLNVDIPEGCIPKSTSQIISGGARGIDKKAREYAYAHKIQIVEILPDYQKYGRKAPLVRNDMIIELADMVIAFWDGKSRGTSYVIRQCRRREKPVRVIRVAHGKKNFDIV